MSERLVDRSVISDALTVRSIPSISRFQASKSAIEVEPRATLDDDADGPDGPPVKRQRLDVSNVVSV